MKRNMSQDLLVAALFMVTKEDVLSCADEVGIEREYLTDDLLQTISEKVSTELGGWHGEIRNIIRDTIKEDRANLTAETLTFS